MFSPIMLDLSDIFSTQDQVLGHHPWLSMPKLVSLVLTIGLIETCDGFEMLEQLLADCLVFENIVFAISIPKLHLA